MQHILLMQRIQSHHNLGQHIPNFMLFKQFLFFLMLLNCFVQITPISIFHDNAERGWVLFNKSVLVFYDVRRSRL